MPDATEPALYRTGWEELRNEPPPTDCPDLTGIHQQQTTLFDRLTQLLSRGLLVGVAMTLVAGLFGVVLPLFTELSRFYFWPALTLSGAASAAILVLAFRIFRKEVLPEVMNARSLFFSVLLIALLAPVALLVQGALTWYTMYRLGAEPGAVDADLLLLESISLGMMTVDSSLAWAATFLAGLASLDATRAWLVRMAPWYQPDVFPTYGRVVVGLGFLGALGVFVFSSLSWSGEPFDEATRLSLEKKVERVAMHRRWLREAWDTRSYGGQDAELVKRLSSPRGLEGEEARKAALDLARSERDRSPADLVPVAWWLDEKLGFDFRRRAPDLALNAELVPRVLRLWGRLDREVGGDLLWRVRHTGTLFALEGLLAAPTTDRETLLRLREGLSAVELTAGDLKNALFPYVVSERSSADVQKLWGVVPYPESRMNALLLNRNFTAIASLPEDSKPPLDALESWHGELRTLQVRRTDRKAMILQLKPALEEDDLARLAGLPARLELARVAVELRLHQLEHGSYPSNLDSLQSESGRVRWEGGELRVEGLELEHSIALPRS